MITDRKLDDPTAMDDTAPLLMATPLYGTVEPETVTFDETALPTAFPATATAIGAVAAGNSNNDHVHASEEDLLWIRATPSVDYSASQSDKPEEPVYRDVAFAVIFWVQLIVMVVLGFTLAPKGYSMIDIVTIKAKIEEDPSAKSSDLQDFETFISFVASYAQVYPERIVLYLLYPSSLLAFLVALIVTNFFIRPHPKAMVTFCLIGAFVDTAIIMLIIVINSRSIGALILSVVVLSVVAYYIRAAWRLIPYSAVNLGVSLEGIQSNCGIYILALFLAEIGFFWACYWCYVLVGTMIYVRETQCPGMSDDDDCGPQGMTFFFMLLSFYWTIQVITNTIQVTVAGVMATWCFDYGFARNCCSSAVWTSLYRSLTYSFGSICFGSLLLGVVRVLRYFVESAKKQRASRSDNCDGGEMLLCALDCLIRLFEEVLEYFNNWTYVFCGIYGYSYLQSGRMVIELFRARGWETIVSDDLIGYVLAFTTGTVGLFTGVFSMCLERAIDGMIEPDEATPEAVEEWDTNVSFLFGPLPNPQYLAFGFGFFFGSIVCSIMMSVVRGAVNTLIVCWADSPARLEENHPEATKEMAEAWTSVFPEARVGLTSTIGLPIGSPVIQATPNTQSLA